MRTAYRELDSKQYYADYFKAQRGGMPVFSGRAVMGGSGIGSVLSGLFRAATPLLKKGATALGKRALSTGAKTFSDVLAGKNVKESLKRRVKETGGDLLSDITNAMQPDAVKRMRTTRPKKTTKKKRPTARRRTVI
jgi:hypothetical protein